MIATTLEDPRTPLPNSATPCERGWFGMLAAARPVDNSCKWGADGFVSTAEDLARFGLALLRGEVVKRESLPLLFSPQKSTAGERTRNGLGWQVGVDQSGRTVGGRSVVVLVPESAARRSRADGRDLRGAGVGESSSIPFSFSIATMGQCDPNHFLSDCADPRPG